MVSQTIQQQADEKNTDKDTAKIMNKLARPLFSHGWAQGLIEI